MDAGPVVDDEELTRLALAGDVDAPLSPDAVPWTGADPQTERLLPEWYMPPPMEGAGQLRGWRRRVAWLLVVAALAVVASGLCNAYGHLVVA